MTKTASSQQPPPSLPTDEFSKLVEDCRRTRDKRIIENTSMAHAAILLKNLMILAKEKRSDVKMVSGRLEPQVYDNLVPEIQAVLDAGCKVDIIALCDEGVLEHNKFAQKVFSYAKGNVISLPKEAGDLHFFVADNAYRVEVDDTAKKAYASFNDDGGVMTELLRSHFSELLEGAKGPLVKAEGEGNNVSRTVGAN